MTSGLVVVVLSFLRAIVEVIRTTVTRYLIKTYISPSEIPMTRWFSTEFIKRIGLKGLSSLGVIASFTLVTFPLGIWISSFSAGMFLPLASIITGLIGMVTVPLKFYTMSKVVHEITFNRLTLLGLGLVEVGTIIGIVGFYLIYLGNKP